MISWALLGISLLCWFASVRSLDNGQALTPPMGWLAWEVFQCNTDCHGDPKNCISEQLFKDMADQLVEDGYRDVGYDRINLDDCWMASKRGPDQRLHPDSERFPSGIPALVDYMHQRGLKLGIYGNMGQKTCMGYPGSFGHLDTDAQTFAEWKVDMVKMDGCQINPKDLDQAYKRFGIELNRTGSKMLYSCSWPYYQIHYTNITADFRAIARNCNMMRTYHDIKASWGYLLNIIDFTGDNQEVLNRHVGPGFWNDPDMLLIGNDGLDKNQAEAQFGLWSLFPAPLLMSNDLRSIKPEFKRILLNREVIAINQDRLGIPGKRIFQNGTVDIWTRELSPPSPNGINGAQPDDEEVPNCWAIGVLNRKNRGGSARLRLKQLGLSEGAKYKFRDVLNGQDLDIGDEEVLSLDLPPTGLRLIKLIPVNY